MRILDYKRLKEIFLSYLPMAAVVLDLVVVAVFYALVIVYVPSQNGDNIEHVHSSFLVAMGQVPYRDFFQHHNPLLWYLFAPVTKFFAYDATVVEIVCFISLLVFLKSLVYIYRIVSEFLADKFWGLMAAAMVAVPEYKLFATDFRPDNYMIFCLTAGIYYLFSYLKTKKQWHLTVAFLWFWVSFLFAQKALFPLACLGVCVLYFWYKNEVTYKAIFKALFLPLIGSLVCVWWLYSAGLLELYYVSNYTFNLNLVEGFEFNRINVISNVVLIWVCIGFMGAVVALFSNNVYWKVLTFLFVTEFLQRRFYFSPYLYYYWLLVYFSVLCGVPVLYRLDAKNRGVRFIILGVMFYFLSKSVPYYADKIEKAKNRPYLPDYVARRINQCDYVFNGDGFMYNLFGKDPAYYWQLIGQLDVVGAKTGIAPRPDINQLILSLKPKFVFGRSYFNKFSKESGRQEIVHYINPEIINTYYFQTGFNDIYQLRSEYDKRECKQDAVTGIWSY